MKKKLMQALRTNTLVDFLANHYDEMSKEDLKDIAKELADAIYLAMEINGDKTAYFHAMQNFKENLLDDE